MNVLPSRVPADRIRVIQADPVNPRAEWVLYWMIANRRAQWNFSLQRAVDWAHHLRLPLVVLEALRCDYRWASDRIHAFVVQGMADNLLDFRNLPVTYYPYVEPDIGDGKGLLRALAARSAVVVSDDFPCFFLPRMLAAAQRQVSVRFELVDSNGIYPMRATTRLFHRAYDFRRHLQREIGAHWDHVPLAHPLEGRRLPKATIPEDIVQRWPVAALESLARGAGDLSRLPIDHSVAVASTQGGAHAAQLQLQTFLKERLARYADARNQPENDVTSGLSPYLHFGHISVHQIVRDTAQAVGWERPSVFPKPTGSAAGWWQAPPFVESFWDELITWRELGYNCCCLRSDYDRYESLPDWAHRTLAAHAVDPRPWSYDLSQLESATTHDRLWNAAQWQLVTEGRIHNYLRMLWGKKILEWTASPRLALEFMIELNNKYALDGRNPNSYSGIFWVLGRYDRPWGPERPIFGQVRYMSSDNTARKVNVKHYIQRYAPPHVARDARLFE